MCISISSCDQSMFCGDLMDFTMICMAIYDMYQHCHHKPRSSWQCNATSRILPYPQSIWMKMKETSMVPCCFMFFSHFLHGLSSGFGGMIPSREVTHIRSRGRDLQQLRCLCSSPVLDALQATKKTFLRTRDAPCLPLAFYDLCCLAGVFHVCLGPFLLEV